MAKQSPNLPSPITGYDINTVNKLAMQNNLKPLTPKQLAGMSKDQVKQYLKQAKAVNKVNRQNIARGSRTIRKNAKLMASENLKQAQLLHGTIRQGLIEAGAIGTEALGGAFGSHIAGKLGAVSQNTNGGNVPHDPDEHPGPHDNDPVAKYSYSGRDEE